MKKLEFTKNYKPFFQTNGLETFDDFFNYSSGQIINKNKKRDVVAFTLGPNGKEKEFFMKRFYQPHFKDMLFAIYNLGRICSQADCEWKNANTLLQNGIDTYRPVCCGRQMSMGMEKKSFFITEKIQGRPLTELVAEKWSELDQPQKEQLFTNLGKLVRKVHDAKISLPDLYLWHIFINENDDQYGGNFAIIDLHRMRQNIRGNAELIKNLSAFDFSLSEKYFDERIRTVFFQAYAGPNYPNKDHFLRKINSRSNTLAARRRRPVY